jgi:hypothetical protein
MVEVAKGFVWDSVILKKNINELILRLFCFCGLIFKVIGNLKYGCG